ncbi:Hypothetical_protein [Hexamita inflata]|uniref:Hypothetical_protein n=1 Tax=Hexamita inflata TaxID=28002 RepID=A0AA86UCC9_9EUKA|nr:Hypothetical protein HINF_LOCUS34276 [Hexamita inflata]CAI9946638.1 Hypothetical protein HINF_LOCUS34283 [Hexamita inflata]
MNTQLCSSSIIFIFQHIIDWKEAIQFIFIFIILILYKSSTTLNSFQWRSEVQNHKAGDWSSGMIPVSGTGVHGFDSRISSLYLSQNRDQLIRFRDGFSQLTFLSIHFKFQNLN